MGIPLPTESLIAPLVLNGTVQVATVPYLPEEYNKMLLVFLDAIRGRLEQRENRTWHRRSRALAPGYLLFLHLLCLRINSVCLD